MANWLRLTIAIAASCTLTIAIAVADEPPAPFPSRLPVPAEADGRPAQEATAIKSGNTAALEVSPRTMRKAVEFLDSQSASGHEAGGWFEGFDKGHAAGRLFTTVFATTILEACER